MGRKRSFFSMAIIVSLPILLSGCLSQLGYGRLAVQYGSGDKMTLKELEEKWQDYKIYYAGLSKENPSAIMFDPKNDDRSLISDRWVEVKKREDMLQIIEGMYPGYPEYQPKLFKILGPDGQLYGYMYTAHDHAYMRAVNEKTLWVDDLPLPPTDYGGSSQDASQQ
jgi:hypothetical protein